MIEKPNEHISSALISLYATGYRHFKEETLDAISSHLRDCEECAERLRKKLEELAEDTKARARVLSGLVPFPVGEFRDGGWILVKEEEGVLTFLFALT